MDVLLVVDMQAGLLDGPPKLNLFEVVQRINHLAAAVRSGSGKVFWVQHSGPPGDGYAPDEPGWELLADIERHQTDEVVHKTLNDPFAGTDLNARLRAAAASRILVCGWATDFCVDATVRSAVSNGYDVVAVSDGHTVSDRPSLDAATVIRHHNWVWAGLIPSRSMTVASTADLIAGMSDPVGQQTTESGLSS